MALSQIYTAVAGDVITAARWNNEFGNIYSNGTGVGFPVTQAVSFAGFTVTFDVAAVSTIVSPVNTGFLFTVGSKTGAPSASGSLASFTSSTFNDNSTAGSGVATLYTGLSVRTPTLVATNALVTTTKAATVYIEAAPIAGTNETITNPYALYVDSGKVQLDGALQVDGALTVAGAASFTGGFVAASSDPYALTNIRLSVVMNASATTIALKTNANVDPSATDVVSLRFRNATLTTGGTTSVNVSAALSLVVSSGSTLGSVSAQPHRYYVGLLNNAGTAELFVYNPLSGANLKGLSESGLISTTAEGGVGGADSAQVAYSTIARSNVAFRIIGFFEATEATAGTWGTGASTIQELQPWMPRTGHVVGSAITTNGTSSGNLTTNIPYDDTIPQSGEGSQVASVSYTPVNAANLIEVEGFVAGLSIASPVGTDILLTALFTSVSANALVADIPATNSNPRSGSHLRAISAGLGAMTTAQIRAGQSVGSADTYQFNGFSTATDLGASMGSYVSVKEIMV